MKYRINRKTGDRISEIGIGSSYMYEAGMDEAVRALRRAYEGGINYFDLAAGHGDSFPIYGSALHDVRENIFYQIHFGADHTRGDYGWSLDLDTVKGSVRWMLEQLGTDYIDYGFIHCQDEFSDWETYKKNGIYDYILELKKQGVVRHIGLSSHTPAVINRILDEADVDMLMFSVNPGYDYGKGDYAYGEVEERERIFRRCEKEGIGISVMKPFSGGQLLDEKTSPFGKALTVHQCLKYILDKPGVLVALPGAHSTEEVEELLKYYDKTDEELDYSVISSFEPIRTSGRCVYCNHCKPCPMGIDIGLVNKYYDLAVAGDEMAVTHYKTLELNASDCVGCGHCDSRCPFSVHQSEKMQTIREYMENR
ncbi:MAG: aldo/keto reductase [Erysipelotrichaceae bacterium]|nr:aldo/keto reductase [Erysipelotrichaceae bacterium]